MVQNTASVWLVYSQIELAVFRTTLISIENGPGYPQSGPDYPQNGLEHRQSGPKYRQGGLKYSYRNSSNLVQIEK